MNVLIKQNNKIGNKSLFKLLLKQVIHHQFNPSCPSFLWLTVTSNVEINQQLTDS